MLERVTETQIERDKYVDFKSQKIKSKIESEREREREDEREREGEKERGCV